MFERFQQYWSNINRENYASLNDHVLLTHCYKNWSLRQSVSWSVLAGRTGYMPRGHYKELMELCLLILGESQTDQSVYWFRQAGAYHVARWMAKVIYSFKLYLFRDQFHLTSTEHRHLRVLLVCKSRPCQVDSWITCPVTWDAPINDLHLLKNIKRYSTVTKLVLLQPRQSLKTTFGMLDPNWCHFLCFPAVCQCKWNATCDRMRQTYDPEVQWNVRRLKADKSRDLSTAELSDLVNSSSVPALHSLGVDSWHWLHLVVRSTVHTHGVHQLCFSTLSQWFVHWLWSIMQLNVQLP